MKIHLKYFASLREAIGLSEETWDTQTATLADLRAELQARGGAYAHSLAPQRPLRMAINHTMAAETAPLLPEAEVAFFPPVTGG